MLVRRLAIFSGFDYKVVEFVRSALSKSKIEIASVSVPARPDDAYFSRLDEHALSQLKRISGNDTRVLSLLVSCIQDPAIAHIEREHFFPALRRLNIASRYRSDVFAARQLREKIVDAFVSEPMVDAHKSIRIDGDAVALLPLNNVRSRRLFLDIEDIYEMRAVDITARIDRDIVRLKGGQAVRYRGIEYRARVGDRPSGRPVHSAQCQLAASLRLGISVPDQFGFDVTSDGGLQGQEFHGCDGISQVIPRGVDQLRMWINGDFQLTE